MAENSGINWTDHSFAPWFGCTEVSPACRGCYARELMDTRFHKAKWGAKEPRVLSAPSAWKGVKTWDRKAAKEGVKRFVFCSHLSDVYDNAVDPEWRERLFSLMRECPNLVFLVLTKRSGNIEAMSINAGGLPENVWLGATVVDQSEADRDIPKLLAARTALGGRVAFVSIEPMLGPINLREIHPIGWPTAGGIRYDALTGEMSYAHMPAPEGWGRLNWVIGGFETDQGVFEARPGNPGWGRSLRDQCAATGTAFWWKQNGPWLESMHMQQERIHYDPDKMEVRGSDVDGLFYKVGKALAGRRLDGQEHNGRPDAR